MSSAVDSISAADWFWLDMKTYFLLLCASIQSTFFLCRIFLYRLISTYHVVRDVGYPLNCSLLLSRTSLLSLEQRLYHPRE